jgi:capping protein beta
MYVEVEGNKFVQAGQWDSINVVEVHEEANKTRATYKLTTTIMLSMGVNKAEVGNDTNLSGSLTRQSELTSIAVTEAKPHLANVGRMIEDMENEMRSNLNQLYILKTREIVNTLRVATDGPQNLASHVGALNAAVMGHGRGRKIDSEASV